MLAAEFAHETGKDARLAFVGSSALVATMASFIGAGLVTLALVQDEHTQPSCRGT